MCGNLSVWRVLPSEDLVECLVVQQSASVPQRSSSQFGSLRFWSGEWIRQGPRDAGLCGRQGSSTRVLLKPASSPIHLFTLFTFIYHPSLSPLSSPKPHVTCLDHLFTFRSHPCASLTVHCVYPHNRRRSPLKRPHMKVTAGRPTGCHNIKGEFTSERKVAHRNLRTS